MSRRLRWLAPVAVALLTVGAACGVPEEGTATIDEERVPEALRSTTSTSTTTVETPSPVQIQLYWVAGGRLVPEPVSFESTPSPSTILSLLQRGVPPGGLEQGLRSALSGTGSIGSVTTEQGTAVVDVESLLAELPESDQILALAQIVATLTSSPAVDEVEFRQGRELLDVPLPDGSLVRRPLRGDDYAALVS